MAKGWSASLAAFAPAFSAGLFGTILGALACRTVVDTSVSDWRSRWRFSFSAPVRYQLPGSGAGGVDRSAIHRWGGIGGGGVAAGNDSRAETAPERFRASFVTLALCGQPTARFSVRAVRATSFRPMDGGRPLSSAAAYRSSFCL